MMLVNYKLFVQSYLGKIFFAKGTPWIVKHSIEHLKHKEPRFVCRSKTEDGEKFATFLMSTIRKRELIYK